MSISIIIPALNEATNISKLIGYLFMHGNATIAEIIVVDGGSTDNTIVLAAAAGARVEASPKKGRAAQMNIGASLATGDIFYFVHADTIPPVTFALDIIKAVNDGFGIGRYRTSFISGDWKLKMNAFFTRFDLFACYGGDQTLFITIKLFQQLNGYNDALLIMEEYDLTVRAKEVGKYKIFPDAALVSARKYEGNSWFSIQRANYAIVKMYKKGVPQSQIMERYNQLIKYR